MLTESDLELPRRLRHAFGGRFADAVMLGSGPHGAVLLARDAVYGEVAVKLLTAHAPDVAEQGAVAVQRASDALDHPRVVHVLEVLRDGGLVALVTPYLSGGSLESRMSGGERFSWEAITSLVAGVAEILDHAHAQHIVHGGVSPSNIIFDAAGRPFLRDFGITQTFAGITRDTAAEAYAAPEWWRGNHLSPMSDQYSLGIIALELVTGRRRIDAPEVEGIQVLEPLEIPATAELRPGLALAANRALSQALAASPGNRYATVGEFARALAAVSYQGSGPRKKRDLSWRTVQLGAVAAAALVAVLVAVDASRRHSPQEGLGVLERGTRGLAEEIDAVTGRARGGVATPDVGPVGGRGARDAASRTAAGAPTPRLPLPDIPDGPTLRGSLPGTRDAASGAAAGAGALGTAVRRAADSLVSGGSRAAAGVPTGNPTSIVGSGVSNAGQAARRTLDSARIRAANAIPEAAAGAAIPTRGSTGGRTSGGAGDPLPARPGGGTTGGMVAGGTAGSPTRATSPDRATSSAGDAVSGPVAEPAAGGAAGSGDAFLWVTSDESRLVIVDRLPRGMTPRLVRVSPGAHRISAFGLPVLNVRAGAGDTVGVHLAPPSP